MPGSFFLSKISSASLVASEDCFVDKENISFLSSEMRKRVYTPGRRQSKTLILATNVNQKSLETVFDCHFSPDWR